MPVIAAKSQMAMILETAPPPAGRIISGPGKIYSEGQAQDVSGTIR